MYYNSNIIKGAIDGRYRFPRCLYVLEERGWASNLGIFFCFVLFLLSILSPNIFDSFRVSFSEGIQCLRVNKGERALRL